MSTFPGSPRLLKGGIVLIDPDTLVVLRIIALQYNPHTFTPTLQMQAIKESGDRSYTLGLTASAERIERNANIDSKGRLPVKAQEL